MKILLLHQLNIGNMKTVDLDFGRFEFYPDLVIGTINEGVHFDKKLNETLRNNIVYHYGVHHPIGYISVRENNYSVDPMIHLENKKFDNLCSVAIVENRIYGMSSIALEAKFFKPGKLKSFITPEDALIWTNKQIENSIRNKELKYQLV